MDSVEVLNASLELENSRVQFRYKLTFFSSRINDDPCIIIIIIIIIIQCDPKNTFRKFR